MTKVKISRPVVCEVQGRIRQAGDLSFRGRTRVYSPPGFEDSFPEVLKALATGKLQETRQVENGIHTLRAVVPLLNEERWAE